VFGVKALQPYGYKPVFLEKSFFKRVHTERNLAIKAAEALKTPAELGELRPHNIEDNEDPENFMKNVKSLLYRVEKDYGEVTKPRIYTEKPLNSDHVKVMAAEEMGDDATALQGKLDKVRESYSITFSLSETSPTTKKNLTKHGTKI
jgi:hypothetical protein